MFFLFILFIVYLWLYLIIVFKFHLLINIIINFLPNNILLLLLLNIYILHVRFINNHWLTNNWLNWIFIAIFIDIYITCSLHNDLLFLLLLFNIDNLYFWLINNNLIYIVVSLGYLWLKFIYIIVLINFYLWIRVD